MRSSISIDLRKRGRRGAFLLGVVLAAGVLCWKALRVAIAAEYADSTKPELWRRANALEPGNAQYWAKLGGFEEWELERRDVTQAAADYEQAVEKNPYVDRYWTGLAAVYEELGETSRARGAYKRAQAAHPISSEVAWRYGNFLLRQTNFDEAFEQFRRALKADPTLTERTVSECWEATGDVRRIAEEVLPTERQYYFVALSYFLSRNKLDPAITIWRTLVERNQSLEISQAAPLLDALIAHDREEDARRVWEEALQAAGRPTGGSDASELIFDGGFEQDLVNAGFGWREIPVPGVEFGLEEGTAHSGKRSLRVTFDGTTNVDYQHLMQYVLVEPQTHYHFSAFLHTEGISTESGIRFQIQDTRHPSGVQILTDALVGTRLWSRVEAEFSTGPQTRLVAILLRRMPTWKFDDKLRGTVWVDDVSLKISVSPKKERAR